MKKIIFLLTLLGLAGVGTYWYASDVDPANTVATGAATPQLETSSKIRGSGIIEADTFLITSETGGRIVAVYAREGAAVAAGDVLVQLDDSTLQAQRVELEAAIVTAQKNLSAARATPQPVDVAKAEAALAQAETRRDGAHQIWQEKQRVAQEPQDLLMPIQDLRAQIGQAEKALEYAEVELRSAEIKQENAARDQSSAGKIAHRISQEQCEAARLGVQLAQTNLQAQRTQLAHLWEQYNNPIVLQAQANQAEVDYRVAQAAVTLAEAELAAAKMDPRPEDIRVAEAQVQVAESGRATLETRESQMVLTAPRSGLVTNRSAGPGEMAVPGAILLRVADLDQVTLRVFLPETKIGQVQLGQRAQVTIDSVDRTFAGTVSYIANEAEFTPQNVQLPEQRVNLVFAVEISLDNPEHILKPGMPADAEILP